MRTIPLAAVPNQKITVQLDDLRMVVTVKEARGVMCASLERDGLTIVSSVRLLAGEPLVPYRYLENGNFMLLTIEDDLPDWRQFGLTQELVYLSQAEIEAIRG